MKINFKDIKVFINLKIISLRVCFSLLFQCIYHLNFLITVMNL